MTVTSNPVAVDLGTDFTAAMAALDSAKTVSVLCHIHPDADTIGSGLALTIALRRKGIDTQVSFAEPAVLPQSLATLPGADTLLAPGEVRAESDVVVTVDCASAGRLGELASRLGDARTVVVIDHHQSNVRFGDINVIDAQADSTTAVLTEMFDAWSVEIDAEIAHCLYAGLVTDTGSFRWTRGGAHPLAQRLLATGIDGSAIARALMDTHPFAWLPMLSRVLNSATLLPEAAEGLGVVYAVITTADTVGVRAEEVESVMDIVRTTAEAEIAVVFKELLPDQWAVSMRAKEAIDVSAIAASLGGGGHRFAAGYTAVGEQQSIVAAFLSTLGSATR